MVYNNTTREISLKEWDNIIQTLNLKEKLNAAKTIIIKPNFAAGTYANPQTHVTTDLSLLKSCVHYLLDTNHEAVIYIAESDSTGYGFAYLKFEHLGLPQCLSVEEKNQQRVCLLDMTRDRLKLMEDTRYRWYKSVDRKLFLSEKLLNADFIISLSNLKSHAVTGYTGACKNLFGCLPDFDKSHNHTHIHQIIHDLVLAIRPNLNIVDAFYGMEKNGPVQGIDVNTGYRVCSNDALEADIFAAATAGFKPENIKYLRLLCATTGQDIKRQPGTNVAYKKPAMFLRIMNTVGLFLQRLGQSIANFGHRIHSCPTPTILAITIARPVLLHFFDYEKLKIWKRKILK